MQIQFYITAPKSELFQEPRHFPTKLQQTILRSEKSRIVKINFKEQNIYINPCLHAKSFFFQTELLSQNFKLECKKLLKHGTLLLNFFLSL